MAHPFGDLLTQFRARKHGLSQAKLAEMAGYDPAIIARMCQGRKDLTGPSGRERVVRILQVLNDANVLKALDEANALLAAADMPPLYDRLPIEAGLMHRLRGRSTPSTEGQITEGPTTDALPTTDLPVALTSFIGRERAVVELTTLMKKTRL